MNKYTKMIGVIAIAGLMTGCATGGGTAVTIYDKEGNVVQETTTDGTQMNGAYQLAIACNEAKVKIAEQTNLGIIQPSEMSALTPEAQQEYMRNLPMIYMATAFAGAIQRPDDGCQNAIVAYYNHKNVQKRANTSLFSKALSLTGLLGGIYLGGEVVSNIMDGASPQISGSGDTVIGGGSVNTAEPYIVEIPVLPEEIPIIQ